MENKPTIICVDDQREILAALEKDMEPFASYFSLLYCESAGEAKEEMESLVARGVPVPIVICDHIMPNQNGIDFLIELSRDIRFKNIFKILLTGLATHQDTIEAINRAQIDYYIEKPWDGEALRAVLKKMLTLFIVRENLDYQLYGSTVDPETLYRAISEKER